uniref:t-SNARE coiled-coil homology domain-containing protein n=1 Tax=Tetraodon nigroviridis TaxID=99883 RepID=H3CIU3_TETNG
MSQDPWLQNYDATCRLAQEIAENIHERTKQLRTGGNPAKINMTIRASLQKLKQNISQLKDGLLRASSSRRIMQAEADRWQSLIDDLLTRERHLNAAFKGEVKDSDPSRFCLVFKEVEKLMLSSMECQAPDEPREFLGLREICQLITHDKIHLKQSIYYSALSEVINRYRQLGKLYRNELKNISEIIDDLAHLVDKTDSRIRNETRRVKLVETKSASCGMLVVIVLLLIAIIVVAAWPKN